MAELLVYWPVLGVLAAALGLVTTEVRADNTDADPASLAEAVTWLDAEANRIIRASRREMKDGTAAFPPQVGIGYEAFWLRDYEYTLEGSVDAYSDKELLDACRLLSRSLRGDGAGVDCVKFDGTPIYCRLPAAITMHSVGWKRGRRVRRVFARCFGIRM